MARSSIMTSEPSRSQATLYRALPKKYPTAISASGVYVTLENGERILDSCCGAAVTCLGYGNEKVVQAMIEQAQRFSWVHTSFFTHEPQEKLAQLIVDHSDGAFSRVATYCSGSEAVESSIKLARQYHLSNGEPERIHIISRQHSYHGNTLGALSAGDSAARRAPFEPMLSPVFHHVSRCFYKKDANPGETETHYVNRLLEEYDMMFQKLGPNKVAAFIVETVGGATLGTVPPVAHYLVGLRKLCDKYGAILIFDEVMCGIGRVGTWHAWQSFGGKECAPDIQAVAKGLGAGYMPISAMLVSPKVYDVVSSEKGGAAFINGHTYQGHALACETALAVQKEIFNRNLLENVQRQGDLFYRLSLAKLDPSIVFDIRGKGLFWSVEFASKNGPIAALVRDRCFENGLATYLIEGVVDGIEFAPPFIISDQEMEEMVDLFAKSVSEVVAMTTESDSQMRPSL